MMKKTLAESAGSFTAWITLCLAGEASKTSLSSKGGTEFYQRKGKVIQESFKIERDKNVR